MNGVKLCCFGMIALGVAIGCGSSSSQPPGPGDGGPAAETGPVEEAGLDTGIGAHCDPLLGQLCGAGQTCCFSGLLGTCAANGTCSTPFQVGCVTKANCGDRICCGSVQVPPGFDASAFDASGFDASGFDASGFDASGFGLTLACSATCAPPDFQLCTTTSDCPSGQRCSGGSNGAGFSPFITACIPIDAGTGSPGSDSGDGGEGGTLPEAAALDSGEGG